MSPGAEYDLRCVGYRREAEVWYALLHGAHFSHVYEFLWRARLVSDALHRATEALAARLKDSIGVELDKLKDVTPEERKLALEVAADVAQLSIRAERGEDVAFSMGMAGAALASLRSAVAQSVAAGVNRVLGAIATGALEGLGAVALGAFGGSVAGGLIVGARKMIEQATRSA